MATDPSVPKESILTTFNRTLLTVYLLSLAISAPSAYLMTRHEVYQDAHQRLAMLVGVVDAIRGYISEDVRPVVASKVFHPPAVSSVVATSLIAGHLREYAPEYYIKVVSDNPMNRDNMASGYELSLLEQFRQERGNSRIVSRGTLHGTHYLISSSPLVSKPGCIACHGDPVGAPEVIRATYGSDSGYHYRLNEVVGAGVVGVPVDHVDEIALRQGLFVVALLSIVFAILFIIVNLLVRRVIVSPILSIEQKAASISQGEFDTEIPELSRNDEIGQMAKAIELMRRSLKMAMRHLKQ